MKLRLICIFLTISFISNAQISRKLKDKVEIIDKKFFDIILQTYDNKSYEELYTLYSEISKTATNDELFYLAKNGSNSLKLYSGKELFKRNDKRFLEIYQYYNDHPVLMKYVNGCVGKKDNIATHLMDEIYAAKEIISIRDSISKEKTDNFTKAQLKSIEDEGYKKLKQKEIQFFLDHLVKKK